MLPTEADTPRWTMGISVCSVCDKDRDPLEVPDEACGHTYTFQKMVDVPVVPESWLFALPLRETILSVLQTMPDEAADEHVAAMVELQVRGWMRNRLEKEKG